MHSICWDELSNLVVKYETTGDSRGADYDIPEFLKEAGFVLRDKNNGVETYVFTKTADPVKTGKTINWTVEKFERVFGGPDALDVCPQLQMAAIRNCMTVSKDILSINTQNHNS